MSTLRITRRADGALHVDGDQRGWPDSLTHRLAMAASDSPAPLVVDLFELELEDAAAVAGAVDALRAVAAVRPIKVRHAPHWLAHSLYRVNALGDRLCLEAPREEEPYG